MDVARAAQIAHSQSIIATSKGVLILPETLAKQGTSARVGDFKGLKGASVEEIVARVPKNWKMVRQKGGEGIRFLDETNAERIRIHGPGALKHPGSNSASGWVLRIMDRNKQYYDDLGNVVPHDANVGHVPIKGNTNLP